MLLRADLHIHSTFSDGRASPAEILYVASEKGLHVISITDHNTFAGSLVASRYQSRVKGLPLVIIGVEVRCVEGDVLVYCEKEIDFPRRVDLLLEKAHAESCLVVPAHPYDIVRLGIGDLVLNYKEWDAIEVWNASSTKGANLKAIRAAQLMGKPGLANSDAHIPEEIGISYTYIEVDELSQSSIMEAIRKGKVKPAYHPRPFSTAIKRALWSVEHIVREFTERT